MSAGYDGRQIVGMDLHRRRSVLVRMTPEGERLAKTRISNSPAALRAEIAKVAAARHLAVLVFYGMRDGHIRALDRPTAPTRDAA